jgi:hypothetical protein
MDPKNIARTALDVLSSLIGPKPGPAGQAPQKKTLEDIGLDDLRREKVRLDQEERKLLARIREIESDKKKLFEEGVKNASEREQKMLARKIKEQDLEARNLDRNLEFISKQLRILGGFIQLKENQRMLADTGVASVLNGIDLQTLQIYIDRASVDGEFHMDKFDEILRTLEGASSSSSPVKEDDDVLQIVRAMQQARESADTVQATSEKYAEVDSRLATKAKETPEGE